DHTLVNLSRHSHVVQIVFANLRELSGLIEIENFAALDIRCFAGFDSQGPGDIVETYSAASITKPPLPHGVENASHVVVGEIHERARCDAMDQAPLKNKRKIEMHDVVTHEFVHFRIKRLHEG